MSLFYFMEEWKYVENTDNKYMISNLGRFKKTKSNKLLKVKYSNGDKYKKLQYTLSNGRRVCIALHRVIAIAFIPNPENKKEVNHKDLNKLNNSIENLEWATRNENVTHAHKKGAYRNVKRSKYNVKVFNLNEIREVKLYYNNNPIKNIKNLAEEFNVPLATIRTILFSINIEE